MGNDITTGSYYWLRVAQLSSIILLVKNQVRADKQQLSHGALYKAFNPNLPWITC